MSKPVASYVEKVEEARRRRGHAIEEWIDAIGTLVDEIEAVEAEEQAVMQAFNDPSLRREGKPYYRATWGSRRPSPTARGVGAPVYVFCRPGEGEAKCERVRKVTSRGLASAFGQGQVARQREQVEALKALEKRRDDKVGTLQAIRLPLRWKVIESLVPPPTPVTGNARRGRLERMQAGRRSRAEWITEALRATNQEVRAVEDQLEELIMEVNGVGRRRNGSLVLRWKLQEGVVNGVAGPYWHVLRFSGGRRFLSTFRRSNGEGGAKSGPKTQADLRQHYLRRHADELLPLAQRVRELSEYRASLVDRLARVGKAIQKIEVKHD